MTTEYERQRLLNISNNKELLNSLALAKPKPKRYGRPASGAPSRPAKRERLDPAPSTRASARLSTQPKPSYAEDNTPFQSLPIQRKKATTTAASRAPPLSEEEVQEIIQRWDWEATAPAPERSEIGTLHFSDHPDVSVPKFIVNSSSHRTLLPRRFYVKVHLGAHTTVRYIPKPSPSPSLPTIPTSHPHGSMTSLPQLT